MIAFKLVFDEGELYGAGVSGFFFFWMGRVLLGESIFSDSEQMLPFLTDRVVAMETFRHYKCSLQF